MQDQETLCLALVFGTLRSRESPIGADPGRIREIRGDLMIVGRIGTASGVAVGTGVRFEVQEGLEQAGDVSQPKDASGRDPGQEIRMQSAGQLKKRVTGRLRMLGHG